MCAHVAVRAPQPLPPGASQRYRQPVSFTGLCTRGGIGSLGEPDTWRLGVGGGGEGKRKGLYHSGIKFNFIFLHIFAR